MAPAERVLLFDVDNTVVDNDTAQEHLHDHLARQFGEEAARRYWVLYEEQPPLGVRFRDEVTGALVGEVTDMDLEVVGVCESCSLINN